MLAVIGLQKASLSLSTNPDRGRERLGGLSQAAFTPDHRHCFRQFAEALWRKIESRFIRFFSVLLKSVKLIHFLTKLKCFVLPAESLVTLLGPLSSRNELMDPLGRSECFPPPPLLPFLSDTVNLSQFQSLIIITKTLHCSFITLQF